VVRPLWLKVVMAPKTAARPVELKVLRMFRTVWSEVREKGDTPAPLVDVRDLISLPESSMTFVVKVQVPEGLPTVAQLELRPTEPKTWLLGCRVAIV
jgi:hypothetical protein